MATLSASGRRVGVRYPEPNADVAQLVEHQLPKLRVAGSNPVVRFTNAPLSGVLFSVETADVFGGATLLPRAIDAPSWNLRQLAVRSRAPSGERPACARWEGLARPSATSPAPLHSSFTLAHRRGQNSSSSQPPRSGG